MRVLKSIRNHVIGRFTLDQLIVTTIFMAIVFQVATWAINYGVLEGSIIGIILIAIALALAIIYGIFFMKEDVLYNSIAMLKYGIEYVQGNTKADKYVCSKTEINSKFPIDAVYSNGIIEFPGKQFGILLELHFPDVTSAGRAAYFVRTTNFINGIPDEIIYKSHEFCSIDTKTPELDQIKKAINDPNTTPEMKEHLRSSYEDLLKVPGKVIWAGHGFIGLGKHKNAKRAHKDSTITITIIEKGLRDSGRVVNRMTDPYSILLVYRQMVSLDGIDQ